jgi:hypothetical protein
MYAIINGRDEKVSAQRQLLVATDQNVSETYVVTDMANFRARSNINHACRFDESFEVHETNYNTGPGYIT